MQTAKESIEGRHREEDRGGAKGHGKLNRQQAREVRELATAGVPYKEIAARFGISRPHVSEIRHRKVWAAA